MNELRYTLLSDGSSDSALIPILTWVLRAAGVQWAIQAEWAELRLLRVAPKSLPERIRWSLELYPCDLLFIHRDAEKQSRQRRMQEIQHAVQEAAESISVPSVIPVIPVRMQEAWLLFDETALRIAAANPRGRETLQLPRIAELERLSDPKAVLHSLLNEASGLSGRRLKKFAPRYAAHRVAELIEDFSPLRELSAFQLVEAEIERLVTEQGWNAGP